LPPADQAPGGAPASGLQAALAIEQAMVAAIAKAELSVAAIARGRKTEPGEQLADPDFVPREYGTGVVVDRRGLILTNYHVLGDEMESVYAVWIGRRPFYPVRVKAADPHSDLAILEVDADDLVPITLGDASQVRKGQLVISLGNPLAIARDGNVSASWGIVSNLGRKAPTENGAAGPAEKETLHHYGTLIQTDVRLNQGTSGGALINLRGEMIGLTTSLAALPGYERSAGFAIPMDETVKRIIEQLKAGQRVAYGFLGVAPAQLSLRQRTRGESGVLLEQIVPGTPAARYGLEQNDLVTHIDGAPVHDLDSLFLRVASLPADHVARITVRRTDPRLPRARVVQRDVTLSKKYVPPDPPTIATEVTPPWRGLVIDYATAVPRFSQQVALIDPAGCVAVVDVQRDSPAWRAGLRPGMFISRVNGQRVETPGQFQQLVADHDQPVPLQYSSAAGPGQVGTVLP